MFGGYLESGNIVSLENVCNFIDYRGKTPPKVEKGIMLLTAKNVRDGYLSFEPREYMDADKFEKWMTRGIPQCGDILFTTEAPLGNVCRIPQINEPFAVGQRIITIQPNKEILNYDYVAYVLQSDYFKTEVDKQSTGSTAKGIKSRLLIKLGIPVPPLHDQEQFSEFAQQSDKSKFYGKSQFIEMFGDIENNCKGYPIKQIDEFSDLFAGATPSTKVSAYWESGTIPWMSSGEVHMGRVTSTEKKITQLGYDKCSTKMVPLHTVVIALAGQGKTRGTVAITEIELCTNQSLCAMITDGTVLSEYLFHNLNNRYEEIRNMCAIAGGRGGLNLKIVGRIKVIVPSIEEQKRFVAFAEQSDKSKLSSIG